jgi:hypothetical protein
MNDALEMIRKEVRLVYLASGTSLEGLRTIQKDPPGQLVSKQAPPECQYETLELELPVLYLRRILLDSIQQQKQEGYLQKRENHPSCYINCRITGLRIKN